MAEWSGVPALIHVIFFRSSYEGRLASLPSFGQNDLYWKPEALWAIPGRL